jgi:hypothetical protein
VTVVAAKRRKNGTRCPVYGVRRNGSKYRPVCDHDPAAPRLALKRPIPENMHTVIVKAMDRWEGVYTKPHEFPEFAFKWLSRARRSERREALVLVGKAMLLRMDICSQRVGLPIQGTPFLQGLPVGTIAAWTGLTPARVKRALADMARANYQVYKLDKRGRRCAPQPREFREDPRTHERKYKARAAVRKFESKVFRRLHLNIELDAAAKHAFNKREQDAIEKLNAQAAIARQELASINLTREGRLLAQQQLAAVEAAVKRAEAAATSRRLAAHMIDVRRDHGEWTAEAQRAEAKRRLDESTGPPE